MTAPTNDGEPRRDFVEHDEPNGAFTLEAHKVTARTEGRVLTAGQTPVDVRAGQVLVRQGSVYEIHDGKAFDEMGLEPVRDQVDLEPFAETAQEEPQFDPSQHTAAAVRRYLRDPELTDEERVRVEEAERQGQNRASAFPR